MMTEQEELDKAVLEYRLHWLNEAMQDVARELASAAIAEYPPKPFEMLELAKWMFDADKAINQEAQNIIAQAKEESK